MGQHVKLSSHGYNIGRTCTGVDAPAIGLLPGKPDSHLKVFVDVKGSRMQDQPLSPDEQVKRDRIAATLRFWPMSAQEAEAWDQFMKAAPELAARMRDAAAGLHDIGPRVTGALERMAATMEKIREQQASNARRSRV